MKWTRVAMFLAGVGNLWNMVMAPDWWFAAMEGLVAAVCFVTVGLLWERYGAGPSLADQLAQQLYGATDALEFVGSPRVMQAVVAHALQTEES